MHLVSSPADAAPLLRLHTPCTSPLAAVALDVEWGAPPTGGGVAPAALTQLAVAHADGSRAVYVVDWVELETNHGSDAVDSVAAAVGGCLRAKRVPCLGFGFPADLAALSARRTVLGSATHAVDVRRILPLAAPELAGASLARVAAALVGVSLDKSLQRSDWGGARPLTAAQVQYAAMDAAVLLDVAAALARRAPPARWPLSAAKPKKHSDNDSDAAPTDDSTTTLYASIGRWWGMHAQAGLASPRRRRRGRGAALRQRAATPSPPPRPAEWGEDGTAASFVCDEACEGLARQLRLLGVSATSAARRASPGGRPAVVAAMHAAIVGSDTTIAVTTDAAAAALLPRGRALRLQPAGGAVDQAAAVLAAFSLRPDPACFLTRCVDCGAALRDEPLTRADVDALTLPPGRDRPPPGVDAAFWVCGNAACSKIFWQGGQHRRALDTLRKRWQVAEVAKT